MKRTLLLLILCFTCFVAPGILQAQSGALTVTCDDNNAEFTNGVEIVISQVRAGFTYTATAIGIGDFDPVLAVLYAGTDNGLCNDDSRSAASYGADLPTSGVVTANNLSSQVTFSQQSGNTFADISLVVGGFNNQSGEFLLVIEGMGSTFADNAGDIYQVNITPEMVNSGVPLSVYMIANTTSLDPYIYMPDDDFNIRTNQQGDEFACDDAGNANLCFGDSIDLSDYSVTGDNGRIPGGPYDAMFVLPLDIVTLSNDRLENYFFFGLTSSPQARSEGEYTLVFHMGLNSEPINTKGGGGSNSGGNAGGNTGGTESGG